MARWNSIDAFSCTNVKFNNNKWLPILNWRSNHHINCSLYQLIWKIKKHKNNIRSNAITRTSTKLIHWNSFLFCSIAFEIKLYEIWLHKSEKIEDHFLLIIGQRNYSFSLIMLILSEKIVISGWNSCVLLYCFEHIFFVWMVIVLSAHSHKLHSF